MVTRRARWLLLVAVIGTLAGLIGAREQVSTVGLAVLAWVTAEWLLFRWRADWVVRRLEVERTVWDERGPTRTLWTGRTYRVETRIRLPGGLGLPYALWREPVPAALVRVAGSAECEAGLVAGRSVSLIYTVRADRPGAARFEGVTVRLADHQGFFYAERFLALPQSYRVLPILTQPQPTPSYRKRRNQLPPPGRHTHAKPGIGSELLQVREYAPGDPLKSVAWKISARRNRLMTRDFESEVPVRCTLFVDTSNSVRIGHPGPTALVRLVLLAGAVVETAVANRDPVRLCLCDEESARLLPPATNRHGVIALLDKLAEAAARPPDPVACGLEPLEGQAYELCATIYPALLTPGINRLPFRIRPLRARARTRLRRRERLAVVLAEHFDLGAGETARLIYDDRRMSHLLQRFLGEHHVPYAGPLYDAAGRYLFAAERKVPVLADAMLRCVRRSQDNELFVLMADLLELSAWLEPLLAAVRAASARHHKVMVLCAWPPGIEPPRSPATGEAESVVPIGVPADAGSIVHEADEVRVHTAYRSLRRRLGRLGVSLVAAAEARAPAAVLGELEMVRAGGRR
jgi:uncharacterized protein (DUF58 family)